MDILTNIWSEVLYFLDRIEPIWYISLVVLLCLSVLFFVIAYKKKRIRIHQMIALSIIPSYSFFIIILTILIRLPDPVRSYELMPFWSYIEIVKHHRLDLIIDNLFNFLIFVPFEFIVLCGINAQVKNNKWKAYRRSLMLMLTFSLIIESVQFVTSRGCCEFDDIINNLIGSAIGGLIYMIVKSFRKKHNDASEDKK